MSNHDRLDQKLNVLAFTHKECGSLDLSTGEAAYCGYDCATLKARLLKGENLSIPLNEVEPGVVYNPNDPRV